MKYTATHRFSRGNLTAVPLLFQCGHVVAIHHDHTKGGAVQCLDHVEERGFSRSGQSHHRHLFSCQRPHCHIPENFLLPATTAQHEK